MARTRPPAQRENDPSRGYTPRGGSNSAPDVPSRPPHGKRPINPKTADQATPLRVVAGKRTRGTGRPAPAPAPAPDRLRAVAVAVLDTTAQLPQTPTELAAQTLSRRAKSKARTDAVVTGLAALADRTPLRHAYGNTLRCAGELLQDNGTVRGKYCGNRWCIVCNRIRTAKLRSTYAPILAGWDNAYFVTLTIPNVKGDKLHGTVRDLLKSLRLNVDNIRRTDKLKWRAVRKLEVTYNIARRDYHPHLHLLVQGHAQALAVVRRHLDMNPSANAGAQNITPCTGERALAELFKYLTKQSAKLTNGKLECVPAFALDVIYRAVRKLRTIQPMGFTLPAVEVTDEDGEIKLDASTPAPSARTMLTVWAWNSGLFDWCDHETGELLAGYDPTDGERRLLDAMRAAGTLAEDPEKK